MFVGRCHITAIMYASQAWHEGSTPSTCTIKLKASEWLLFFENIVLYLGVKFDPEVQNDILALFLDILCDRPY